MLECFAYMANGRAVFFGTACLALLAATGCGKNDLMSGQGTVNYQGKPLDHGRVGFHPGAGRPSFGEIHDGKFLLTTHKPNDGVAVGKYRVTVHCDVPANPTDAFSDRVSLIPARYQKPETSGLTAEVKSGEANDFQFELTK